MNSEEEYLAVLRKQRAALDKLIAIVEATAGLHNKLDAARAAGADIDEKVFFNYGSAGPKIVKTREPIIDMNEEENQAFYKYVHSFCKPADDGEKPATLRKPK